MAAKQRDHTSNQSKKSVSKSGRDYAYFTGDKGFWDDGDFKTSDQKLVYAMLWQSHGTDIAGIRSRNDKLDSVRVCIPYTRYAHTLSALEFIGKIKIYDSKIWIKSAIWRNLNRGHCSEQQIKAVVARIAMCGADLIVKDILEYYQAKYNFTIPYAYPIDTPTIPYRSYTDANTDANTDTDAGIKNQNSRHSASAEATELSEFLKSLILRNKPDMALKQNCVEKWAEDIDRMIRLDKRAPSRIRQVIQWALDDTVPNVGGFCWAPNIQSGGKLRDKFDRLEIDMQRRQNPAAIINNRGW